MAAARGVLAGRAKTIASIRRQDGALRGFRHRGKTSGEVTAQPRNISHIRPLRVDHATASEDIFPRSTEWQLGFRAAFAVAGPSVAETAARKIRGCTRG